MSELAEKTDPHKTPVFVLGSHRSGTSAVTGLLHKAGGLTLGELMPATPDNPRGYFETMGIVEAHRDILRQLDADWTCPPNDFDPTSIDISALEDQVAVHHTLPEPWGVKDPRSMFMLKAWLAAGVREVRLIGVVRREAEIIRSLTRRDELDQLAAEAIAKAYLTRMHNIALQVGLPVVEFSNDSAAVLEQTRRVAVSLGLEWDSDEAESFFEADLVRNRAGTSDYSQTYRALADASDLDKPVPVTDLSTLELDDNSPERLHPYYGPRNGGRRNELWSIADFALVPDPEVTELLPVGARSGRATRPNVHLTTTPISHPLHVGSALRAQQRPNGVLGSGMLDQLSSGEIEIFFKEVHLFTDQLAEAVFDVTSPAEGGPRMAALEQTTHPTIDEIKLAADGAGWDVLLERQLTPLRKGIVLRKRLLTDSALVPVVADLLATADRVRNIETVISAEVTKQLSGSAQQSPAAAGTTPPPNRDRDHELVSRAEAAELDLARLRGRRSVRIALALSKPFAGLFRIVRKWRS